MVSKSAVVALRGSLKGSFSKGELVVADPQNSPLIFSTYVLNICSTFV